MLRQSLVRILNHWLLQETWARTRLEPFAGQTVQLASGALSVSLTITDRGLFERASPHLTTPSVTISLPADWPQQALASHTSRPAIFALARISGSVDLAEALGFVFRNLRWDVEGDLSLLFGDIAAHRLVKISQRFAAWHLDAAKRLAVNLTEFLVEESPGLARKTDIAAFCTAVDAIRGECDQLENRFQQLERL
jgi:ubiquinone biosynthesis protein UbiJ